MRSKERIEKRVRREGHENQNEQFVELGGGGSYIDKTQKGPVSRRDPTPEIQIIYLQVATQPNATPVKKAVRNDDECKMSVVSASKTILVLEAVSLHVLVISAETDQHHFSYSTDQMNIADV